MPKWTWHCHDCATETDVSVLGEGTILCNPCSARRDASRSFKTVDDAYIEHQAQEGNLVPAAEQARARQLRIETALG